MSSFIDFLTGEYTSYFGLIWDSSTMTIRTETPNSVCFEIEDKKPSIKMV